MGNSRDPLRLMLGRFSLAGLVVLVASAGAYVMAGLHFGTFDPRAFFASEPGLRQIAELSEVKPRVLLSDLLEDPWDYVCFVPPYHAVAEDPRLPGLDIPWSDNDGFLSVVLKRGADYDLQRFSRAAVVSFQLTGLPEGRVCYESTAVMVEHVAGEGPVILRVSPQD
jgi:hypothetical protein